MKKILLALLSFVLILIIIIIIIGPTNAMVWLAKPSHSFASEERAPIPDYSLNSNWAALPEMEDASDLIPEGVERDTLLKNVDVFYIHPTGFLKGTHWNSVLNLKSGTEENTKWMLANQASIFSDANVYAPRYREATIFSFMNIKGDDEQAALQLAYDDVERAFDYFITNYNQDKPFVLVSHSQGSFHALPLIKNRIDQSAVADRLIAAYVLGMSSITTASVSELVQIEVCREPTQTSCLIHWATFAEGAKPDAGWGKNMICVNPISWTTTEVAADKSEHHGYVENVGSYNFSFSKNDEPKNIVFKEMKSPKPNHTGARCFEGRLYVEKQEGASEALGKGNYHGLDFQLFHMDIRNNLSLRTKAYFQSKPAL